MSLTKMHPSESSREPTRDRFDHASLGRRMLVVEDEARLRDMLSRAVRDMGFEICTAGSAESGMRILEERPIDIVIVDLNLPGMNGLELIEIIHKRWPDIQPIVLTGFGDLASAKKAMHMDAVDFLTKPCRAGRSGSVAGAGASTSRREVAPSARASRPTAGGG